MTDRRALKAIVETAMGNGFKLKSLFKEKMKVIGWEWKNNTLFIRIKYQWGATGIETFSLPDLIANHDFMRALVGKSAMASRKTMCRGCGGCPAHYTIRCNGAKNLASYEIHQQQTIILPRAEWIGYLKRFITKPGEEGRE